MAEETRAAIEKLFGTPADEKIMRMAEKEEREEASTKLILELCGLYHISLTKITYFYEDSGSMGAYGPHDKSIALNIKYLMTGDRACIREYLDTIVHELRHAVQRSAIEGDDYWQVPEERQKSWLGNMVPMSNYISFGEDPEGYYTQPVEMDAFTFAHYVMEGVR